MLKRSLLALSLGVLSIGAMPAAAQAAEALVNTGSPATPFPQNKQNEPTVAIDPTNPSVLVAGVERGDRQGTVRRQRLLLHPGCRQLRHLLLLQRRRELGPAHLPGLERSHRYPGRRARSARCRTTSRTDWSPTETRDGLRAAARLERQLQLGERLAALLLEPDLEFRHRAQGPDFKGFEAIAVSHADDLAAAAAGDAGAWSDPAIVTERQPELDDVLRQVDDVGGQRGLEPPLRDGIRLLHAVPEPAGHGTGEDRGEPLDRRRRHLDPPGDSELGLRQSEAPGPPGMLDPDRQQGHRLRRLGGPEEGIRIPAGPVNRRRDQVREAAHRRERHRRRHLRRRGVDLVRRDRRCPHQLLPEPGDRQRRSDRSGRAGHAGAWLVRRRATD